MDPTREDIEVEAVVEIEAARLWDVKRAALMHDARYEEIAPMERTWLRALARHTLAEKRRLLYELEREKAARDADVGALRALVGMTYDPTSRNPHHHDGCARDRRAANARIAAHKQDRGEA